MWRHCNIMDITQGLILLNLIFQSFNISYAHTVQNFICQHWARRCAGATIKRCSEEFTKLNTLFHSFYGYQWSVTSVMFYGIWLFIDYITMLFKSIWYCVIYVMAYRHALHHNVVAYILFDFIWFSRIRKKCYLAKKAIWFNSLRPGNAYIFQWTGSSLV